MSQTNSDQTDGPLATLQGARDLLRKLDHTREVANVTVLEGVYEISSPLEFLPQDGGTAEFPVTYRAVKGAKPIFCGGRSIAGWKREAEGLWSAESFVATPGGGAFEQLWVNGVRATRARHPNHGFFRVTSATEEVAATEKPEWPKGWSQQTIGMNPADIGLLFGMNPTDRAAAQIVVHHAWETTRRPLSGLDTVSGVLTFMAPPRHPDAGIKAGASYYLENSAAFLDAPGEWFLNRNGKLYYRPRPGEKMSHATVIAPRLPTLIAVKGDAADGRFVEHLYLQGLAFSFSQWITPPDGVFPIQSAVSTDAAIMVDGAKDFRMENCEISHTGGYALWLRNGCSASSIRSCLLQDLGGGGIRIGSTVSPANEAQRTFGIQLDNNIICQGGRIFASAVGIWIGRSCDNSVTHNEVADFYSTGISVGWEWGYADSSASGNRINFNHVHHLGWGALSDMGAIYTLGISPGTECRGNVIHDIAAADYGGWGIYLDEGSSEIRVEDNLVYATTHGGFHQHYGRENIVRNNIFALGRDAQLQLTHSEPHRSLVFEHNIVYWKRGELFAREWSRANIQSESNLFFCASGGFDKAALNASETGGRDLQSVVADPGFRNVAKLDFTLAAASPARQIGFKPFDYHQAGVYGSEAWRKVAEKYSRPAPPDWLEADPFFRD